jgi:CRP/FNR family transcriptional regulator, cyclic AMP receptor protein
MSEPAALEELPPIGLLAELEPELRRKMAAAGRVELLPAETRLANQGTVHHTFCVLLSGKASVHCHAHGDYVHVADIKAGETVGEMNLIDPQHASADVIVTEKARVWIIDIHQFQEMVEADPPAAYTIMAWLARELCRRLRRTSDHMLRQASEMRTHMRDIDY